MFCFLFLAPLEEEGGVESDIPAPQTTQSILQPIKDAAKFCRTWQMGLLYGPIIFSGKIHITLLIFHL